MSPGQPTDSLVCPHCAETTPLKLVVAGVHRCPACAFFFPRPRRPEGIGDTLLPPDLAGIAPGRVLRGRYRLVQRIGFGAHGLTYFAEHEFLNHPCVIKILPQRVRDASDAAVRRLRHEAQVGFRVNNPHVVRVLDCDAIEGVWYFAMEYVEGADLATLIRSGVQLGWQQAARLALDAAQGLTAIHHAGLIHRDIKPANLLLGIDGRLRISDLGVAGLEERRLARGAPLHETVGTLDYAAPELFEPAARVDARADLYSVGATLFHAVTGRTPFADSGVFRTLIDAQNRTPQWPPEAAPDVPDWFVRCILRLLRTDADERLPSAEALGHYLQQPDMVTAPVALAPPPAPAHPTPRGIAILPFENESGEGEDDWLGFTLADSLGRELARAPGVFLASHEQLLKLMAEGGRGDEGRGGKQLLSVGRLVGAGTVITGRFQRSGDEIRFWADVHRQEPAAAQVMGPIQGVLSRLMDLQIALRDQIAALLCIPLRETAAVVEADSSAALAQRERLARGKQAYLRGDYETAIRLANELLAEHPDLTEAMQYLSACCARLGRYEEAADYHGRLTALAEARGDQQLLVEADANIGVMHYFRGEYDQAAEYYTRAANLAERLNLSAERAQIYNNAGFALFHRGRHEEAEQAFRRAVELFKEFGALASLVGPYNGLGNVLLAQRRYGEAREFYQRALTLAQELGDRTNSGVCHMHLGRCASLQGRFSDAKNEFALALNSLDGTSFWNVLARTYEYMAEMNLRLGSFAEAVRCADKKIQLARRHTNWTMEAVAWQQKAEALRGLGCVQEAEACAARARAAGPDGGGPRA